MQDFTVPALSLSTSRAKKQYLPPAPTRDYSQMPPAYSQAPSRPFNQERYPQSEHYMQSDHYLPQEPTDKLKRMHVFPPRAPTSSQEVMPNDINKNVYLQSPEVNNSIPFPHPTGHFRQF